MKVMHKFFRKVCNFVDLLVCEGRLYMVPFRTRLQDFCSSGCKPVVCVHHTDLLKSI